MNHQFQVQPISGDSGYVWFSVYHDPKPEPDCDLCKDDGISYVEPCPKCGYIRF